MTPTYLIRSLLSEGCVLQKMRRSFKTPTTRPVARRRAGGRVTKDAEVFQDSDVR